MVHDTLKAHLNGMAESVNKFEQYVVTDYFDGDNKWKNTIIRV